jgi:hypothetical protein
MHLFYTTLESERPVADIDWEFINEGV